MTYLADDSSIQGSRPVELYEFINTLGVSTRYTSYHRDFVFGGNMYTAVPAIKRGQLAIMSSQNVPEMTVELPRTDAVVAAFCGVGIAPQRWQIKITRVQQTSGGSELICNGYVSECSISENKAVFRAVQLTNDGLSQSIPSVLINRGCQHVHYDPLCGVARGLNQISPTITVIDPTNPRLVTVSTVGGFVAVDDFVYGELLHIASGERRSIIDQAGTLMTLDVPLPTTAAVGNVVTIFRGCARLITVCRDKFANAVNFGGHPHLIASNPWESGHLLKTGP